MDFVDIINKATDLLGMSQRQLAFMIGASNSLISIYSRKKTNVPTPKKIAIAFVLSKELDKQIESCRTEIKAMQSKIDSLEQLRFDLGEWL